MENSELRRHLLEGQAIPALPLALNQQRRWSEKHQRAVIRYYLDAGVGGIAVGVHSTQFEIREAKHGLFEPLLKFAAQEMDSWLGGARPVVKIAGICGKTPQALREAGLARACGYDAGLLSLSALKTATLDELIAHCRVVAAELPVIGFYLQPAVGGRILPLEFWRRFAEIPEVVAVKIAPFNRYQTLDVVRAVAEAGRDDIALYTGNDDNIIADLLTPWEAAGRRLFIVGGLLGQFGVWTRRAVELLGEIKTVRRQRQMPTEWLTRNAAWTDANAAVFDAANGFAGVIAGIHEVLRRQGIFATNLCLNPRETLSPGQAEELDRVAAAYPWLVDDSFVAAHLHRWLS
ncbi:MAG: dihydrodipicolinate synthase family protein [Terrimicrobiaceae bacterium]|nr:dihydrodipicolinate synthase family protein [Terrimicrobiaceae bacterium]